MKIACITPSRIPSSTANSIQAVKVSHALVGLGHSVRVYFPGDEAVDWDQVSDHYELAHRFDFVPLPTNPRFKKYDFIWNSLSDARKWKADVVYTWLPQSAWLAGQYKIPSVLEMHDRLTGTAGPLFFRWFLGLHSPHRLLVITRALQKRLEKQIKEPVNPEILRLAPNGVDIDRYRDLPDARIARTLLNLPNKFTAVYTGHFYPGRGMNLLLELAGDLPGVSFVWVGGKPEDVAQWQQRIDQAGINNVTLTGFIPKMQVPLYQAAGDVLLMPYEQAIEGSSGGNSAEICSPMKMFDYLATGRVIMTSELPVLHEILNVGNAVFCPPVNVDAWANSIDELQADHARAVMLARQAKQDAEKYSWENRARLALEGLVKTPDEKK